MKTFLVIIDYWYFTVHIRLLFISPMGMADSPIRQGVLMAKIAPSVVDDREPALTRTTG
jgi:hypothetical protein